MNHKTDMEAPTEIYVWFADNKGTERDGERFIRAWTMDPVRADGLRGAIGRAPAVYRTIEASQSAGVTDDIAEGLEILDNFIASVRENGNYSTEAALTFIGQARQCFAAAPAPVSAPAPDREQATLCEDGGKCGIGGYCGQCEKVRAASEPGQPSAPDYTDCCDTPSLCSSVRRCTAQDAPRARGAACPHGVDDGACKQCYGEAMSGEQGAANDQNSAKHRYFVYDPEGNGFDLYDTDAQREAAHLAAIAEARQAAMDDGEWSLDVERIVSGFVTHATVAAEMDGGGCDYAPLSAFSASAPTLGELVRDCTEFAALQMHLNTYHKDVRPARPSGLAAWALAALTSEPSQPQAAEPKGMTEEQRKSLEHAIWNFDRNRFVEDARNLRALLSKGE